MNPHIESLPPARNSGLPDVPTGLRGPFRPAEPPLRPDEYPSLDHIVTEDDTPLDNIFVEKQQRLLVEPLYSSWPGPGDGRPFLALANVGLFYVLNGPPLVPDVMLSLGVRAGGDLSQKENRSYFVWVIGKPPDVALEIISETYGEELDRKMQKYGELGIRYYVIYDPEEHLKIGPLRCYGNHLGVFQPLDSCTLDKVGLGLVFWQGSFEDHEARWLRWCDRNGNIIPTGKERADQELHKAEQEKQRAEQEKQRAEKEKQRAEQLAAQLRALGIEPLE